MQKASELGSTLLRDPSELGGNGIAKCHGWGVEGFTVVTQFKDFLCPFVCESNGVERCAKLFPRVEIADELPHCVGMEKR